MNNGCIIKIEGSFEWNHSLSSTFFQRGTKMKSLIESLLVIVLCLTGASFVLGPDLPRHWGTADQYAELVSHIISSVGIAAIGVLMIMAGRLQEQELRAPWQD